MEQLILVGTSGLANEILDFINRYKLFEVIGFTVNESYIKSKEYLSKPVYAIEKLDEYVDKDKVKLFSTISYYNYLNRVRKEKFDELKEKGFTFANLVSPHAVLYTDDIGEGNWFHDYVHVGYNVKIGNDNIFRTKSNIEHYSVVGNHNCFTASSCVGGHVIFGDCSFIGLSAVIYNRIIIGNKCVIGGGAIVKSDLQDYSLCVATESFVKQCDEEKIEKYISPEHVKRSVEEIDLLKLQQRKN